MFYPLAFFIGLRYTCAKKRTHFISFISLASMLGIALGITVLVTVLSVMNGFDYEIHSRIFSTAEHVKITGIDGVLTDWQGVRKQALGANNVVGAAPYVLGQGMISNSGSSRGVMITGVDPAFEPQVSSFNNSMLSGNFSALKAGEFGVVLGGDLAAYLGVSVGDKVTLITPQATMTPVGVMPRFKRFTVVGVFHAGDNLGSDTNAAFINLTDAQKLLQFPSDSVSGLRLRVKNLYDAPAVSDALSNTLPSSYTVTNWTEDYGTFFKAIRMEKTTMFVVLLFIVAVAAFNLVSSLVMTVTDKQSDIAILRTLGASPKAIMAIFMVQGSVIGCFGTLLGVIGGVVLALNAPAIVSGLEHYLHVHFISSSVYFINYLPSKLVWSDVIKVGVSSLLMSLVATIYPSWRASKTEPAEALRYE